MNSRLTRTMWLGVAVVALGTAQTTLDGAANTIRVVVQNTGRRPLAK
jgi:hypothetical protein